MGELATLCNHSHGRDADAVPELRPLGCEHAAKGSPAGKAVTLCSIADLENVNALDIKQEPKLALKGLTTTDQARAGMGESFAGPAAPGAPGHRSCYTCCGEAHRRWCRR